MNADELFSYAEKWFVLMHESLYFEDPNIIGFRDVTEWESIFEEALIVYYQFGTQYIRGIYEVTETGRLINPNFGSMHFDRNELQYQCRLKLIYDLNYHFTAHDAESLSFYKHIRNKSRWDKRRVFDINDADLKYLLSLV